MSQIDEIITASSQQPILIFKHSTRCAISKMALKDFEKQFRLDQQIACYFLDLLAHRDISNEIAHRFEVIHQSPQLLLIKNGKCLYNVSHGAIDATILDRFLEP
ncbi:bacillithiol system redox-active protein YtxJ [Flavobacterium lotistagni]|uniref:bacillithiol system redox-active protein YtxJ n=1 Tax=Flavobacterium lotistagni TaxID=2709660 RepID=UPI00293BF726|nr:bacillithiol system redox-active protein YtxJ [Flavobacterium lotistagni]